MSVPSSGDVVCMGVDGLGCGCVVEDHHVDTGAQFRVYSDDNVCIIMLFLKPYVYTQIVLLISFIYGRGKTEIILDLR
jgi:hypothetical protein